MHPGVPLAQGRWLYYIRPDKQDILILFIPLVTGILKACADYFALFFCRKAAEQGKEKRKNRLRSVHRSAVSGSPGITVHGQGRGGHQLFFAEGAEGCGHIVVIHDGFRFKRHFKTG
jgi:hypothetical protein